jgi:hypothetical protein
MFRPAILSAVFITLLATSLPGQAVFRTVRGEVRDTAGKPLESVDVIASSEGRVTRTGADGRFTLDSIAFGEQRFLFRRVGFNRVESTLLIGKDDEEVIARLTPVGVTLDPVVVSARPTGLVGVVGDASYRPLAGVEVEAFGGGRTLTDSAGRFSLPNARAGGYLLQVRKRGYYPLRRSVTVPRGEYQELSVLLLPVPSGLRGRRVSDLSGYNGRVAWALGESAFRRARCAGGMSVLIPREEFAEAGGRGSLDLMLPRTRTAASKGYSWSELRGYALFIDGQDAWGWPLSGIHAEDVEAVEIYKGFPARQPLSPASLVPWRSMGGAFAPHRQELNRPGDCPKATIWVWLR